MKQNKTETEILRNLLKKSDKDHAKALLLNDRQRETIKVQDKALDALNSQYERLMSKYSALSEKYMLALKELQENGCFEDSEPLSQLFQPGIANMLSNQDNIDKMISELPDEYECVYENKICDECGDCEDEIDAACGCPNYEPIYNVTNTSEGKIGDSGIRFII